MGVVRTDCQESENNPAVKQLQLEPSPSWDIRRVFLLLIVPKDGDTAATVGCPAPVVSTTLDSGCRIASLEENGDTDELPVVIFIPG